MGGSEDVISARFPYLDMAVQVRGWQNSGFALIDTGYTGNLIIPAYLGIDAFEAPDGHFHVVLGDGRSSVEAPFCMGDNQLIGFPAITEVEIISLGDEYILGRGILDRFEIVLDHGQRVILRA
ncbi:MAG: hypothetical protein IIB17_02635 [Chloroflexi bacterium]|nr:hypothetical protein [Chloroflexota bacterium]